MTIREANRLWKAQNHLIIDFGARFQEQVRSVISPLHDIEDVANWMKNSKLSAIVATFGLLFAVSMKYLSDDQLSKGFIFVAGFISVICFAISLGIFWMIRISKSYASAKKFCSAITLFEEICQVKFGEEIKRIVEDPINPWVETYYLQAAVYAHVAKLKFENEYEKINRVVKLAKTLVSIKSFA